MRGAGLARRWSGEGGTGRRITVGWSHVHEQARPRRAATPYSSQMAVLLAGTGRFRLPAEPAGERTTRPEKTAYRPGDGFRPGLARVTAQVAALQCLP